MVKVDAVAIFLQFLKTAISLDNLRCADGSVYAIDLLIWFVFNVFLQMLCDVWTVYDELIKFITKEVSLPDLLRSIAKAGEVNWSLVALVALIECLPTIYPILTKQISVYFSAYVLIICVRIEISALILECIVLRDCDAHTVVIVISLLAKC